MPDGPDQVAYPVSTFMWLHQYYTQGITVLDLPTVDGLQKGGQLKRLTEAEEWETIVKDFVSCMF